MRWLDYLPECYDILMCMQKCQDSTSGTCILDCGLEKISNNEKFQNLMHCMVDHNCVPPVVSKKTHSPKRKSLLCFIHTSGLRYCKKSNFVLNDNLIFSSQKTECALLMTRMLWTSPICPPWKETGGYSKDRTVAKGDPKTGAWGLMRKYQTSNKKGPPRDRSISDADQSQSQSDLVNFSA